MTIQDIKKLADGTQFDLCGFTLVKTADGLYCRGNGHLYTWINVEVGHLARRLTLKTI